MSDMSQDNTIEYTIEENDNNEINNNINSVPKQHSTQPINGLNGIPPHVINQLPSFFFNQENVSINNDVFKEFMLRHNANMKLHEDNMSNVHPNEYLKRIVTKEKTD